MSRNSKNTRNLSMAKQITTMHKNGSRGPAKTTPLHGKKWGYRTNPEAQKRLAEMVTKAMNGGAKTGGAAILAKSGGAAKPVVRAHVG